MRRSALLIDYSPLFQAFLTSTRVVFGRHSTGHVFPLYLIVKPGDGMFTFAFQRLVSSEQFLLVSSKGHTVLAGSQESLALLGVRRAPRSLPPSPAVPDCTPVCAG